MWECLAEMNSIVLTGDSLQLPVRFDESFGGLSFGGGRFK